MNKIIKVDRHRYRFDKVCNMFSHKSFVFRYTVNKSFINNKGEPKDISLDSNGNMYIYDPQYMTKIKVVWKKTMLENWLY
jgi:pyocin large subunit-like protein